MKKMITRSAQLISVILTLLVLLVSSCSTRGINDKYFGATEQRLITQSVDNLVKMLPEKDFMPLKGRSVYLQCHFLEDSTLLAYAKKRLELELMDKYNASITQDQASSDNIIHVFFNAIGTEQDTLGLKTPEFVLPGVGGSLSVDILTLDMYHGVSELYYYIIDTKNASIVRGEKLLSIIRTDRLALPLISIPISTLE